MKAATRLMAGGPQRRVRAVVGLALMAVLAMAVVALLAVNRLGQSFDETRRTQDKIGELRGVITALSQSEAAARGYVLTGLPHYRGAWKTSSQVLQQRLSASRKLLQDNAGHAPALHALDSMFTLRIGLIADLVRVYESEGIDGVHAWSQTTGAGALTTSIVSLVENMQQREYRLLLDNIEAARGKERRATVIISLSTALTALLLLAGGYAIMRDVRRRLETEARLRDAVRAAAVANEAKTRFLATVSHEIRTPLNAVVGMTELLLDTKLASEQMEFARTIHTNSESLSLLISDLLDFSKIEAGQVDLESIPFDPGEIAESVAEILAIRAEMKGLDLILDISPELPASVEGDPNRFRQVLMNLVGNAIKFTDRGEVVVSASVLPNQALDTLCEMEFSVRDTGIGIAPEYHEKIFDRFVQAERSTVRRFGGTGLGLTISRSLVELMQGDLSVESEIGTGSVFSVRLPSRVLAPPRLHEPEFKDSLVDVEILLADSSDTRRRATARYLSACGARVLGVDSGSEAMDLIRTSASTRVAIVHETLKDMTGGELIARLQQDDRLASTVKVLLLCSLHAPLAAPSIRGVLADSIYKPARQARLLRSVLTALGHKAATQQAAHPGRWRTPTAPGISPPRVLLVEDRRDNWVLVTRLLTGAGYAVDLAEDGMVAVERAARFRYDLVLMDIELPLLDGFQATGAIRAAERAQHESPVPIVALTAHAVEGYREKGMASGMDDYITKPLKKTQLLDVCDKWIDKRPWLLIADDSAENHVLLGNYLKDKPYRLLMVDNGLEAVNAFKRQRISLVLLDMDMPVMDGYEAARTIRRLPGGARVPIVAATGYEGAEERMRCLAAGCTGYLLKPMRRNEVAETIARMLGAAVPMAAPGVHTELPGGSEDISDRSGAEGGVDLGLIRKNRVQLPSLRRLALQGDHESLLPEIEKAGQLADRLDLRELRHASSELMDALHRNDAVSVQLWIDQFGNALKSAERLLVVREAGLLDTPPEEVFDRLVQLAARIFHVPTALITVVDQDRQFFKSALGVKEPYRSLRGTPISHSFCHHVATSGEPLVVENARFHPLVKDSPAIDDLDVIAYAGMPLLTDDGVGLGSFCVIDSKPRHWSAEDLSMLSDFAALALSEWKAGRVRTATRGD